MENISTDRVWVDLKSVFAKRPFRIGFTAVIQEDPIGRVNIPFHPVQQTMYAPRAV